MRLLIIYYTGSGLADLENNISTAVALYDLESKIIIWRHEKAYVAAVVMHVCFEIYIEHKVQFCMNWPVQ